MEYYQIAHFSILFILSIAYALAGLKGGRPLDIAFFCGYFLALIFVLPNFYAYFIALALIVGVTLWFANNHAIVVYWALLNFSITFCFIVSIFALFEIDCFTPTEPLVIFPMLFGLLAAFISCYFWSKSDKQNRKIIFSCLIASIQLLSLTFDLFQDSWFNLVAIISSCLLYVIGYFVQHKSKSVEIL